jgi:hypothetical protein
MSLCGTSRTLQYAHRESNFVVRRVAIERPLSLLIARKLSFRYRPKKRSSRKTRFPIAGAIRPQWDRPASLDNLVGAGDERGRNGEAEGHLEINGQVETHGLVDWKIAGLGALEDLVGIGRSFGMPTSSHLRLSAGSALKKAAIEACATCAANFPGGGSASALLTIRACFTASRAQDSLGYEVTNGDSPVGIDPRQTASAPNDRKGSTAVGGVKSKFRAFLQPDRRTSLVLHGG